MPEGDILELTTSYTIEDVHQSRPNIVAMNAITEAVSQEVNTSAGPIFSKLNSLPVDTTKQSFQAFVGEINWVPLRVDVDFENWKVYFQRRDDEVL